MLTLPAPGSAALRASVAIAGAFALTVASSWLAILIGRQLGLESLEIKAWVSLLLTGSTIAFLFALFPPAREACLRALPTLTSRTVLTWSGMVVAAHLVLLVFALVLMKWIPASARPTDVGWTHYLNTPPDARAGWLLHYLLVSALETCGFAPVAEELLHAGVVIGSLRAARVARPWIQAINALLFVLLHQVHTGTWVGWQAAGGYVVARVLLDSLYYKTGNIAVPILAHATHNTGALAVRILPLL